MKFPKTINALLDFKETVKARAQNCVARAVGTHIKCKFGVASTGQNRTKENSCWHSCVCSYQFFCTVQIKLKQCPAAIVALNDAPLEH